MMERVRSIIEKQIPYDLEENRERKNYEIGNEDLFTFAREIALALTRMGEDHYAVSITVLREYFDLWYTNSNCVCNVKVEYDDDEELFAYFLDQYEKIDIKRFSSAFDKAMENINDFPIEADGERSRKRIVISLCYHLQIIAGDKPFFLSGKKAGEIVGRSSVWGGSRLKELVRDGIIKKQELSTARPKYQAYHYFYVNIKQKRREIDDSMKKRVVERLAQQRTKRIENEE